MASIVTAGTISTGAPVKRAWLMASRRAMKDGVGAVGGQVGAPAFAQAPAEFLFGAVVHDHAEAPGLPVVGRGRPGRRRQQRRDDSVGTGVGW